ncbi:hypothetical protein GOP47_0022829 [Adiantum capillus-veneris]|uniref:DNA recombination-mediator protein A n=1 Tax=Adiantum capillus-veneris TaxID=13818 RepID=A0A9D4Z5W5_ADICA|nr:hypothetical protein GOP47_0022829 [Adiantum capillus-veneris]
MDRSLMSKLEDFTQLKPLHPAAAFGTHLHKSDVKFIDRFLRAPPWNGCFLCWSLHSFSSSCRGISWSICGLNRRGSQMPSALEKDRHQNGSWQVHAYGDELMSQAEAVVLGTATSEPEYKAIPDLDYLQELLAIQQQGPTAIGFFGTRNMGFTHQQLIEVLSYAMVITKNHVFTSGASGTNAAVIRGALRAERPDLLTVILPQSLKKQPPESQELLSKVKNVIEMPHNDHLPLIEASRICNWDILTHVQQVICFAFHDSNLKIIFSSASSKKKTGIVDNIPIGHMPKLADQQEFSI